MAHRTFTHSFDISQVLPKMIAILQLNWMLAKYMPGPTEST